MTKLLIILVLVYTCQPADVSSNIENIDNLIDEISEEDIKISKVVDLSPVLSETSGLINFNGKLITHNDSGGVPFLYEIDIKSGGVARIVEITNAAAIDIEDIAQDNDFIYLCDIGNNSNHRKNQTILKISKEDFLNSDKVIAEKIGISYNEQIDFSKTNHSTNFDAEAVVVMNNNLFLFTKNWGNFKTSVYKIPVIPGNYKLEMVDIFDVGILITGADYNKINKTITLTGYKDYTPFIVILSDFSQDNPLNGKIAKKSIIVPGSIQIEGIAVNPDGSYYISAEQIPGLFPASLYKMTY